MITAVTYLLPLFAVPIVSRTHHLTSYVKTAFYGYLAKLGTIVKVRSVVNQHRKGNIWSPILKKKYFLFGIFTGLILPMSLFKSKHLTGFMKN